MATATVGASGATFRGLAESSLTEPTQVGAAATRPLLTDEKERRVPLPLRGSRALVFMVSGHEPAWFYHALHGFQQLLQLPPGWDSYEAKLIEDDVIVRAAEVLVALPLPVDAPAPCIVPGSSGSVQLEWHEAGADIEIHVSAGGHVSAYLSDHRTGQEVDFEMLDLEAYANLGEVLAGLAR